MGSGASRQDESVGLERITGNVFEDNKVVIKTATVLQLPQNTIISRQSYHFKDRNVQTVIFVEGPGVMRIGLTTTDPKTSANILEGSVFEVEEGFNDNLPTHRRVLYRSQYGWFCFGRKNREIMFESAADKEKSLWLYIINVYGRPKVDARIYYDDSDQDGNMIELCLLGSGNAIKVDKDINSNTGVFKLSEPVINNSTYHIRWDMRLTNERIPGKSHRDMPLDSQQIADNYHRPEHGFMCLRLHAKRKDNDEETVIWKCGSAIKDYPFSSVVAFCVSLSQKTVTHNIELNSVGKTKINSFTGEVGKKCYLYMTVEFSCGQISIIRSTRGLIQQKPGSILLMLKYPYDLKECSTTKDIWTDIESKTDCQLRRIQFGTKARTFVVEVDKRLEETDISMLSQNLKCNINHLKETTAIQVISLQKEDIDDFELQQYFSRKDVGGGAIKTIKKADVVTYCWIITFEKESVARKMWLRKTHLIKESTNTLVLPFYEELGLSVNNGEIPVYDKSPLVLEVDKNKLRFVIRREKTNFVTRITQAVLVRVVLPEQVSDKEKATITFECQVPHSEEDKLSVWKTVCQREVEDYFSKCIHVTEVSVPEEKWTDAVDEAKIPSENVDCTENESLRKIVFVGADSDNVQEMANNIRRFLKQPETIEKTIEVDFEKYLALEAEGKLKRVGDRCRLTSFKVNKQTGTVKFRGPADEVDTAENEVLRLATGVRLISVELTEEILRVAETKKGKEEIAALLRRIQKYSNFFLSGNRLNIYASADDENKEIQKSQISKEILNTIVCKILDIQVNAVQAFSGHNWKVCKSEIENKVHGPLVLTEEKNRIKLCGTSEAVEFARKYIADFIEKFKTDQYNIRLSHDEAAFLNEVRKQDFMDQLEFLKDDNGSLTGDVRIQGKSKEISTLQKQVIKYVTDVTAHWFYLKKAWLASLAKELSALTTIEHQEDCLLRYETAKSLAAQGVSGVAVISHGALIQVRQGDITFETTDVLVNIVSGGRSSFDAGLAKYLCHEGGLEIREQFMEQLQKYEEKIRRAAELREAALREAEEKRKAERKDHPTEGQGRSAEGGRVASQKPEKLESLVVKFPIGTVLETGPGKLRCRKIVHVVPPAWIDGKQSDCSQMKMLVQKILEKCDELGMKSVSIPALVYKKSFPEDKVTEAIVETVAEYLTKQKRSKIKEIILCDSSTTIVKHLTDALGKLKDPWFSFIHGLKITVEDLISTLSRRSGAPDILVTPPERRPETDDLRWQGRKQPVDKPAEGATDIFSGGLPFRIQLSQTLTLCIKKGDLTQEQVDVLVSPTPEFPDLKGEVANAVIKAGGESIRRECRQLGAINEGEIRKTGPGNIGVSKIFHARIPKRWDPNTGRKFVYNLVLTCLSEAEQSRSVAFPVIGAGNSGFPADVVAKAMIQAVREFAKSNSTVQEVSIVVYAKAEGIIKIFESEVPAFFRKSTGDGKQPETASRSRSSRRNIPFYDQPHSFDKRSAIDDIVFVKIISINRGQAIQKMLEKVANDQFTRKQLNFKELTREPTLTKWEKKKIKGLQPKFGIDIEIDQKSCCVVLSGIKTRVDHCEPEALNLLQNEFPRKRLQRREEENVAKIEQWYLRKDGVTEAVEKGQNYELWKGHKNRADFNYLNKKERNEYSVRYISEGQMEEWPTNDPTKKRQLIRRTDEAGIVFPPNWSILTNNATHAQVVLQTDEGEFNDVRNKFLKDGCNPTQILKISRLENQYMYKQYQLKKRQLERINPQAEVEKLLWHGTSADTAPKIIRSGYDRSYAGDANMAVHGQGVYFAVQSSYSDRDTYARPDANGVKRMFLNRVLTGVFCKGSQAMKVLPPRPHLKIDDTPVLHDSAVDDVQNPGIFVIFSDTQAYPEYLIEYKK